MLYCTVGGNPLPVVEWSFKGRKLPSGAKYLIKEGELIVKNLNYCDAGQYICAARNILGSSVATSNLSVRGKREYNCSSNLMFFSFFLVPHSCSLHTCLKEPEFNHKSQTREKILESTRG